MNHTRQSHKNNKLAGGSFQADLKEKLDWYFDNFDLKAAAKGLFEPARGMDEEYDAVCDAIENIKRELTLYKEEMCSNEELTPRQAARSSWKYININIITIIIF